MLKRVLFFLFGLLSLPAQSQNLYFPPLVGKTWDTIAPQSLGWCTKYQDTLFNYLQDKNTRGFLVLVDGKIAIEKYFGNFNQDSFWYWASAGKTMSGLMVGIAQQKGLLTIEDASSTYLGKGWTSLPAGKEDLIKIKHQLSMSSGLDDNGVNKDCTYDSCLVYKADAGTRWAYHNAPYTLLDRVIENASGQTWQSFFNTEVRNKTGILGIWLKSDFNNVLYSNVRSMGRFGLLLLNKGSWNQNAILSDTSYFRQMTNTSQTLNPSYGYLTWLNGKNKLMVPTSQIQFNTSLAPNAPADMFAAMGKNGQLINVVPSLQLVMVRIGDAPGDNGEVPITFNNDIWFYLNKVLCKGSNSIAEFESTNDVNIFPNPATSKVTITGLDTEKILGIELYDLMGNRVQSKYSSGVLEFGPIGEGLYVLKIETEEKSYVKRLIKN